MQEVLQDLLEMSEEMEADIDCDHSGLATLRRARDYREGSLALPYRTRRRRPTEDDIGLEERRPDLERSMASQASFSAQGRMISQDDLTYSQMPPTPHRYAESGMMPYQSSQAPILPHMADGSHHQMLQQSGGAQSFAQQSAMQSTRKVLKTTTITEEAEHSSYGEHGESMNQAYGQQSLASGHQYGQQTLPAPRQQMQPPTSAQYSQQALPAPMQQVPPPMAGQYGQQVLPAPQQQVLPPGAPYGQQALQAREQAYGPRVTFAPDGLPPNQLFTVPREEKKKKKHKSPDSDVPKSKGRKKGRQPEYAFAGLSMPAMMFNPGSEKESKSKGKKKKKPMTAAECYGY